MDCQNVQKSAVFAKTLVALVSVALAASSTPAWARVADHDAHEAHEAHEKAPQAEHSAHGTAVEETRDLKNPNHPSLWQKIMVWFKIKKEARESGSTGRGEKSVKTEHSGMPRTVVETYKQAFIDIQTKADRLLRAERENEELRLQNSNLKIQAESLQYACSQKEAAKKVRELRIRISRETGSAVGRTLATIDYRPPNHLLPAQLYTLGLGYLKEGDDEKAAVIFTFLTGTEEAHSFKRPQDYLLTGVAWYRLENFELADQYFARTMTAKGGTADEARKAHAQARLWRALVANQQDKKSKVQYWLVDLVDHHPHSMEAAWVNSSGSREAGRVPSKTH
ncbi:hypothetical protein K2X30_11170 [bacterium]|jgi:hypothetical protein|nr:hypothetical protein [bacterium]